MCGIVGIVNSGERAVDESVLQKMCGAIVHRGPDDEGYYVNRPPEIGPESRTHGMASVGLGIRRLSIIDLSTGKQPIHNEDKTVWVVLNGEIYNQDRKSVV